MHSSVALRILPVLLALDAVGLARSVVITPSTASCDDLASCAPQSCQTNTESDCSFPSHGTPNFASSVASATCRTCTQATSSHVCKTMADTLSKSGGIQAAYCTDQFLVVWATGKPRYDPSVAGDYLRAIPNPPGGDQACRVRTSADLLTVFKIPLQTQSLAAGASNSIPFPLPNIPGMPAAGAVAMAVDGVPAFPNYNNRGQAAAVSCEIDRCNAHAGKGEDYHYHGWLSCCAMFLHVHACSCFVFAKMRLYVNITYLCMMCVCARMYT